MIQELDPNPFFVRPTYFELSRKSASVSPRPRSLPARGTAADDLPPAGRVAPARVFRRPGFLDRAPIALSHYPE